MRKDFIGPAHTDRPIIAVKPVAERPNPTVAFPVLAPANSWSPMEMEKPDALRLVDLDRCKVHVILEARASLRPCMECGGEASIRAFLSALYI